MFPSELFSLYTTSSLVSVLTLSFARTFARDGCGGPSVGRSVRTSNRVRKKMTDRRKEVVTRRNPSQRRFLHSESADVGLEENNIHSTQNCRQYSGRHITSSTERHGSRTLKDDIWVGRRRKRNSLHAP